MKVEDLKIGETYSLTFLGEKYIMKLIDKDHARRSMIVKLKDAIIELGSSWMNFKFEPISNSLIHEHLDIELII